MQRPIIKLALLSLFLALLPYQKSKAASSVAHLVDLPGSKWRVSPPLQQRMALHTGREPRRITVHYTDTAKNSTRLLEEKLRVLFHFAINKVDKKKKKSWGDIPYHYFIDVFGKVGEARYVAFQPDSNTDYKLDGHITIVVEGNPTDGINSFQRHKLFLLLDSLQTESEIPNEHVGVHKDFASTDCPGTAIVNVVNEYKMYRGKSLWWWWWYGR